VKPASFEYHAPATLDEALALVERYGDDGRVIAGGQSLVPMMNLRLSRTEHLVDINSIRGLDAIEVGEDEVAVGALVRHRAVERSSELGRVCPLLPAAARNIGHFALRSRGTMGGSLALADPAAEYALMAMLLDARIEARSTAGARAVPARAFFVSVFTTALEPEEIVTAARFRAMSAGEGWGFRWLSRRAGDYAIVHAAVTLALDDAGAIERVGLALGGVGPTPLRLEALELASTGRHADRAWVREVAAAAAKQVDPAGDKHGSAEYRRELVEVLLGDALADALERIAPGSPP
jgi:carbon-monoxide dehydrogenase medium subunit